VSRRERSRLSQYSLLCQARHTRGKKWLGYWLKKNVMVWKHARVCELWSSFFFLFEQKNIIAWCMWVRFHKGIKPPTQFGFSWFTPEKALKTQHEYLRNFLYILILCFQISFYFHKSYVFSPTCLWFYINLRVLSSLWVVTMEINVVYALILPKKGRFFQFDFPASFYSELYWWLVTSLRR